MRPITVAAGPLASASANAVCLTQTPTSGALTLNGALVVSGVAVLDVPRQVLFTFAANETGHNFVVRGTSWAGDAISETVAGTTAGTVATVLSYKTVTSITISANATGALTVGTNAVASSPWVFLDCWAPGQTLVQCRVSGTANYTVQTSSDDPNSTTEAVAVASMVWLNSSELSLVAATASNQAYLAAPATWIRVVLNSGSGAVSMVVTQAASATF